ncbi:amidase [Streptomyces atratus]|uniref:Amidase n=1 Tax=Streptomyces atratus TaxID=1893 RepID=A0A2Z5JNS4_STRAR|nr:amidase [Streptomyces atratus]AXE81948.1 amidase [Streptomyces atratus]
MTDLHYLSAHELLEAYRTRALSPVEVLDAVEDRADAVEPTVNALSHRLQEQARSAAVEAEARYAGRGGGDPRPLEGIPVAAKEEQPVAGLPLRLGSLLTDDTPSPITHPVVERVLAAGGIVHAQTTTPEYSCAAFTQSALWGVTRNPWNLGYGPGGSSGGSGAALAAGTTILATGSDIGGSIRLPASLCGVVGFKPPYARVPGVPPFNLDTYCHDGPMARTVADTALLQNLIAGAHPMDPVSLPAPQPVVPDATKARGLKVAFAATIGDFPIDPDVAANTRALADSLRDAGIKVEEVAISIPHETVFTAALIHYGAIFGPMITELGDDDRLSRYARRFADRAGQALTAHGFFKGLCLEADVQQALADVFADYDAIICPTLGSTGFLAGDDHVDHGVTVDGTYLDFYLGAALTPVFNVASRHPVLNIPTGRAANGVPTGAQIVGRAYDDATPFHIGAAAEEVHRWWADPTWRPDLAQGPTGNQV